VDVVDAPELELDVRVECLVLVTFACRPVCHRVDLTAPASAKFSFTVQCSLEAVTSVTERDRIGTISGTVPAWNNIGSIWSRNIFCSGGGTC